MRIGIGLPAAVPGADVTTLGQWAADGEHAGFDAVGVFHRLGYDNLDPLVALAVAAACTQRVGCSPRCSMSAGATTRSCWPSSWPRSSRSPVGA